MFHAINSNFVSDYYVEQSLLYFHVYCGGGDVVLTGVTVAVLWRWGCCTYGCVVAVGMLYLQVCCGGVDVLRAYVLLWRWGCTWWCIVAVGMLYLVVYFGSGDVVLSGVLWRWE